MAAFRVFVAVFLLSCERSSAATTVHAAPYDVFDLASRPLPETVRLHRHPREISPARVREITGGRLG